MQHYEVRDGERIISFEGRQLAAASSKKKGKTRWIELRLYITRAGTYVLSGCGRSTEEGEVDRPWVQLAEDPEGIIDRLYLFNELGAKYIPHTSLLLLQRAAQEDERVKQAYDVQHVA